MPDEVEGFELASDQSIRRLRLPGAEGDFEIKNAGLKIFVQDRRKIGGTWFELRLQLPPGESSTSRSIAFQLDTTPAKIEASREDASLEVYPNIVTQKDIPFLGEDRAEKMDLYLPQTPNANRRFPAVLVIHGGGWATGDKADRREIQICQTLAKAGFAAASINYLLYLKTPTWPTNIHDVKTGIRYLRANAAKLGIDPENIGTIGGSAGGHLAMLMGWSGDDARLDPPLFPGVSTKVKAVVDLYGVPDLRQPLSKGTRGCGEPWIGKKVAEAPEMFELLSPVSRVEKSGAPVFILHGTKDTTVPISYSETLVKILKEKDAVFQYKVVEDA
ncbi:MAG: alpha/beta hydrolase, partial [Spirochaetia bacterium]|nr:alpha/beta hydrolase [Spirochaetia bacterium]